MADANTQPLTLLRKWGFAVVWVTLPFTAGPALADTLDPRSPSFRTVASLGLWVIWAVTLVTALVPRTVTLTAIRIVAPAAVVAVLWGAAVTPSVGPADLVAIVVTGVAAAVAFLPSTGDEYVNGSSYGDERRLPLRAPSALLLGPIELAWAAVVAGAVAGPLLLAAHVWIVGALALLVGWPIAWWSTRSLHTLARRWLVFTPAGVVLHDQLVVLEAMLVVRRQIASITLALADTTARDLTLGSPGLAVEIRMTEPLAISPTPARRLRGDQPGVVSEDVDAVLITPTRPGVVLTEAARRRLPVG
ncbi:MAG: hypothetical protein ACXWCM_09795 [Acidimicrobiales bacterium]